MASERIQLQIARLLDEADAASVNQQWQVVRERAQSALAFDPDNADAKAYLEAAERALQTTGEMATSAPSVQLEQSVPTSFAHGRHSVTRFLGEGGKKKVYMSHDSQLLPHALTTGRVILAYSPLAQGLLSGRYDATHRPGGFRGSSAEFSPAHLQRVSPLIDALGEMGERHDAMPSQVALAWLIHQPNVIAIPGARSVSQVEQNAAAANIELSEDEMTRLGEMGRQLGGGARHFGLRRLAAWLLGN